MREQITGDNPVLAAAHRAILRQELGISDEVIEARGYWTITDIKELVSLGFSSRQLRQPGLLLPVHGTDGSQPFCLYRSDKPRTEKKDGKERIIKYEMPAGCGMRLDCPPTCRPLLADPSASLWVTEGQKKADALVSRGACARTGVMCGQSRTSTLRCGWKRTLCQESLRTF